MKPRRPLIPSAAAAIMAVITTSGCAGPREAPDDIPIEREPHPDGRYTQRGIDRRKAQRPA